MTELYERMVTSLKDSEESPVRHTEFISSIRNLDSLKKVFGCGRGIARPHAAMHGSGALFGVDRAKVVLKQSDQTKMIPSCQIPREIVPGCVTNPIH